MGHSRRFCHIRYTSGYRLISDIGRVKAKADPDMSERRWR
jgi:hypothetical protein